VSRFLKDTAAALRDRHPGPSLAIVAGPDFRRAAASAVGALLALALGSALGDVRGRPVHLKVIALTAAAAFLLFGALTIKFVAGELDRIVAARGGPAAASAVRLLVAVTGYVLLLLAVLDVLAVPVSAPPTSTVPATLGARTTTSGRPTWQRWCRTCPDPPSPPQAGRMPLVDPQTAAREDQLVGFRLNRRPARSTPVTTPVWSRVKKPRWP